MQVVDWISRGSSLRRDDLVRLFAAIALIVSCDNSPTASDPDSPPVEPDPPSSERIVFIVSHPDSLNGSENQIRERAEEIAGRPVATIDDDAFTTDDLAGCVLVLISKNADDNAIGAKAKPATCGILFWEENQQQLRMLATMDNDGSAGTVWHTQGQAIHVRGDAPDALRDGLSGEVELFDRVDEMSFGRRNQIPETAIIVAEYKEPGNHKVIYAFERGARLADDTAAAGRRVFFGLYRDNFHHLTAEGSRLFDAALRWALTR